MAVGLSPIGNDAPFLDASGNPLNAGELYIFLAGSSTPAVTYQDDGALAQNANPIILNANGYPASGGSVVSIWLTTGATYLFTLKTAAGVTVWSRDDIEPINDTTVSIDEWVTGPAPTFVSTTSFTLVGDQTSTFHAGRRLKSTNSGGTIYSTILSSAFGASTTVTVVNDSGVLDSGLSAVSYALLAAVNKSVPPFNQIVALGTVAGTNTITASATTSAQGYVTNQIYVFIPAATNTGATTLNVNSVGAKNIFKNGAALVGGEIRIGVPVLLQYDGTQLNIIGPDNTPTLGTEVASTSGTSIDFTGIPAYVKRITITLIGVSTSGTDSLIFQLGDSGGVETTNYLGASGAANFTIGFGLASSSAANVIHGSIIITKEDNADNAWVASGVFAYSNSATLVNSAGSKPLSSTLDRVRVTTVSGTDTFDAGVINILYE